MASSSPLSRELALATLLAENELGYISAGTLLEASSARGLDDVLQLTDEDLGELGIPAESRLKLVRLFSDYSAQPSSKSKARTSSKSPERRGANGEDHERGWQAQSRAGRAAQAGRCAKPPPTQGFAHRAGMVVLRMLLATYVLAFLVLSLATPTQQQCATDFVQSVPGLCTNMPIVGKACKHVDDALAYETRPAYILSYYLSNDADPMWKRWTRRLSVEGLRDLPMLDQVPRSWPADARSWASEVQDAVLPRVLFRLENGFDFASSDADIDRARADQQAAIDKDRKQKETDARVRDEERKRKENERRIKEEADRTHRVEEARKREEDRKLREKAQAARDEKERQEDEKRKEEEFVRKEAVRKAAGAKRAAVIERESNLQSRSQYKLQPTSRNRMQRTNPLLATDGAVTTITATIVGKSGIAIGLQVVSEDTGAMEEHMIQLEEYRSSWAWAKEEGRSQFTSWFSGDGFIRARVHGTASNVDFGIETESGGRFLLNLDECCDAGSCIPRKDRPSSRQGEVMLKWSATEQKVGFYTSQTQSYPIFAGTTSWKPTERVRFMARTKKSSKVTLEDAPLGGCSCAGNACIRRREDCVTEGGLLTLEYNSSADALGFKYITPGREKSSYLQFGSINIGNRGQVHIAAKIEEGSEVRDLTVTTEETQFLIQQLRKGATQAFADGGADPQFCLDDDLRAGRSNCVGASAVCCGTRCHGVCQKCKSAKTAEGGYCMCYPVGYYSDGVHVKRDGACILPPNEDGSSIPKVDDVQPAHIKAGKLHGGRSSEL
jgi:hypothetical protein